MLDFIRGKAQSVIVKIAFGIIILVFVFWGVGGLGGPVVAVITTVNDIPITEQDFRRQFDQSLHALEAQSPDRVKEMAASPEFRHRVLQQMIVQTILLEEAERIGLAVTPFELRKIIEGISAFQDENGKFNGELYVRAIENQGQSLSYFEEALTRDLLVQKLREQVTAGTYVAPSELKATYQYSAERRKLEYVLFPAKDELEAITITPEAIKAYYEAQKNQNFAVPPQMELDAVLIGIESLAKTVTIADEAVKAAYEANKQSYATPEQVRASHIILLLGENPSAEKVAEVEAEIQALAERLKKGESFEELAKAHSADGSAQSGGDLGYFSRATMVAPFTNAAFALEDGAISEPVRTQFGYHLIKRVAYKPAGVSSYEDVADALRSQLAQDEAATKIQDVLDQFLLAVIGGKNMEQTAKDLSLTVEAIERSPLANIANMWSLTPEQLDTISKAPVGVVLETPLVTPQGYLLVQPKAFVPASVEPLEAVEAQITETLRNEEAIKLAAAKAVTALEEMRSLAKKADAKGDAAQLAIPTALSSKIQNVSIGRDGIAGELGSNSQLTKAVFAAELGTWLPEAFAVNTGTLLVRVADLEPYDESQWPQVESMLQGIILNTQKDQMFQAFTTILSGKARIEMHNQRMLLVE